MGPRLTLFAFAAAVTLTTACRQGATDSGATRAADPPNVLLVTIDTLRADRVGWYGYQPAATPTLDALGARGVRFKTAIAQAPLTGPSHASILTGLTPLGHGFRNNGGFVLAPTIKTAAEDFRKAGYRTGAVVSGFPLDRRFGFDRGFEGGRGPPPARERSSPNAVRRASGGRQQRRGAQVALDGRRRTISTLVPLAALLRSARAVRAAGRYRGALPVFAVRR